MKAYDRILRAVRSTPWAIQPEKLEAILGFLQLKAEGKVPAAETLAQIHAAAEMQAARAQNAAASSGGSVAVLPLYGLIMHRGNMMSDISGPQGTSTEKFAAQFRQAMNDPNVKAIVIDVDSPGGEVAGVQELADEIYAARGKKKITAVSNCLMASSAYYIASAASEVVVSPSSQTGSIGVYLAHEDDSKMLDELGVKMTLISYGENKTAGNSYEPLGDGARADMQAMVDAYGAMFERAVARGRGVSQEAVRGSFGQGKLFTAQLAVKLGMADRVGTLDSVLAQYGVSRGISAATMRAVPMADSNTLPAIAAQAGVPAIVKAGVDCTCPCDSCVAGDCSGCNCDGCDSTGCTAETCNCDDDTAGAKRTQTAAAMRRRLQLAGA